jgi:hypothetical protein
MTFSRVWATLLKENTELTKKIETFSRERLKVIKGESEKQNPNWRMVLTL